MKAVLQDRYGTVDVLRIGDVDRPVPGDDEVLVRVRATSVHPDVWHVLTGLPYVLRAMGAGLRRPKNPIPGTDIAGVVEAVGARVTRFRPGDEVFGETLRGMQWVNGGAFAEYAVAPEFALATKPANVSFEAAAATPTAGLIALQAIRTDGKLRAGQRVLVNGAGGGVGSMALQMAKAAGAEVTGVDAGEKAELLVALGADHTIDYERMDFTRGAERYDFIVDVPGNHSFAACRRALAPDGLYVLVGHDSFGRGMRRWFGLIPRMFGLMFLAFFQKQLPRPSFELLEKSAGLEILRTLLAEGKLTPHVERAYPLSAVKDALRALQSGRVRGKIVLLPGD